MFDELTNQVIVFNRKSASCQKSNYILENGGVKSRTKHEFGLPLLSNRMSEVEKTGIQVNSLILNRGENIVLINNFELDLTASACETLAVLCEARLDDEVISGTDIEALISGKNKIDCDEANGAMRIKRLRDNLGNQMMSELLIKNVSKKGYVLTVDKGVIKVL